MSADRQVPDAVPAAAPPREPHLFRFGLRQFFLFVSGIALLLGVMAMLRGGRAVALAFGAAMVAAHVLATFVGTRLRNSSRDVQRWSRARFGADEPELPPARAPLTPAELAALTATPLAQHDHAPRRTWLAFGGGLLAGGTLGAAIIPLIAGQHATGAEIGLGTVSCAVMGGWLALLASHFWSVARRAWRDANQASAPPTKSRRRGLFRRVSR
jgi:uncharacterized membrane protein